MSFLAAAFLGGLAALALPWWLHRRDSHSARQRTVSSLYLMRASETPEVRHKTLRYRVLLALRLLLLAVLALAFAQPVLDRGSAAAGMAEPAVPRVIVLDTSLSMTAALDRARDVARALIDGLPDGGRAAVVAAGAELAVLAPLTTDRTALRAAVAAAQPGWARLAFDGLLGRVATLAGSFDAGPVQIHLVSDFQRTAWPTQFNALLEGLDGSAVLHPVAGAGDNWRVAGIEVEVDGSVAVTVHSFAATARAVLVSLVSADGNAQPLTLNVPAGGSATAVFEPVAAADGDVWLRAAIDGDDAIAGDDVVYRAVPAAGSLELPVFADGAAAAQREYLRAAVNAAAGRFRPAGPEARGPVAVLLDPGTLSAAQTRLLARHLDDGGSVLVTAGPATARAGRLAPLDIPLRPGRLDDEAARRVVRIDVSHPALAGGGAWRDVAVFRHVTPREVAATVLMTLDDGAPLLLEYPLPAGRLLALTTALDPQWSTLVAQPAFVAFVADALGYLADDFLPAAAVAGQALAVPAASMQLFDRDGRRLLALEDTVGRSSVRIDAPGIYTLRTPSRERLLAVNTDGRESDPRPAAAEQLARWRSALEAVTAETAGPDPTSTTAADSAPDILPLAPWLLALLGLLAVLEPLAANSGRSEART